MIKILDCTTRDGGYNTNWKFETQYVIALLKKLEDNNVSYFEIGYRNHFDNAGKGEFYNCSPEFLEQFYNKKGALQIGVMTDSTRFLADDFPGIEYDKLDFVRVATHPDKIRETLEIAENLYSKGYKVFVQLMDVSHIEADGYLHLFAWENKHILQSLYFADSYGILTPYDVEQYYNKLKILGYNKISFHGHNNNGKVMENSLKAAELGVFTVDTTDKGIGRRGGNLNLDEFIKEI